VARKRWTGEHPGAYSATAVVKVEWVNLGEGFNGDYDPSDPEDEELLRWDAYVYCPDPEERNPFPVSLEPGFNSPWCSPADSSYCTYVPVGTPVDVLGRLAEDIADALEDALRNGGWKHVAAEFSAISV